MLKEHHNLKQDNQSTVRAEERKTLPAPPPPPKPVDTPTSNFPIPFFCERPSRIEKGETREQPASPAGLGQVETEDPAAHDQAQTN